MYKLVSLISVIARYYYLPNPFGNIQNGVIINFMMEPILQGFTFKVVGLFYERRSSPALGSFLYLFFYSIHTCLIMLCGMFNFTKIAITMVAILYVLLLMGFAMIKNELSMDSF